jgi:hypothetical protein
VTKPNAFMRVDALQKPLAPNDDKHDVIILPKNVVKPEIAGQKQMVVQRFPIDRENGSYDGPEDLRVQIPGGRKARALAAPDESYGPGLLVAPTRPEPAAQNGTCIIINQEHVRVRNAWTAARLNSEPQVVVSNDPAAVAVAAAENQLIEPDIYLQPIPNRDRDEKFEMLIASGGGKIYYVRDGQAPEPLENLGNEGEIWYQLRNGFVAGSVFCRQHGKVLPMVNVLAISKVNDDALLSSSSGGSNV